MNPFINPNQFTNSTQTSNSNGANAVNPYSPNYFNPGTNSQSYPTAQNSYSPYFQGYPSAFTDGYHNNNPLGLNGSSITPMGTGSSGNYSNYLNPLSTNTGTLSMSSDPSSSTSSDTTLLARFQGLAGKLDIQVNTSPDEKIDTNDLRQALDDKSDKYSTDDKQVIQAMLDNTNGIRGKLDHLDGKDDGIIKIDSINKMVVDPNAQPEKVKTPEDNMSNTKALNVMADYMGTAIHLDKAGHRADKYVDKHGMLIAPQRGSWTTNRAKLQRMSEDTEVPEMVRTAAKKLLTNKELYKVADIGHHGGNPDGTISIKDCQDAIKKNPDIDSLGAEGTVPEETEMPAAPETTHAA